MPFCPAMDVLRTVMAEMLRRVRAGARTRAKVHENNSFLDEYSLKNCFKSPRIVSVLL